MDAYGLLFLLLGLILGGAAAYLWAQRTHHRTWQRLREVEEELRLLQALTEAKTEARVTEALAHLRSDYESKLQALAEAHRRELAEARRESLSRSRAVLKGKMAEQMAPLLPGFDYLPADARFLGDPVDYVVFDGYSACKDGGDCASVEIVILDVKQGRARLSRGQKLIAEAVAAGRVRFEIVRVSNDGTVKRRVWP